MERFNDQEENNQEMPDQGVSFDTSNDSDEDRPKGKEDGVYFSSGDEADEHAHFSEDGKNVDIPIIEIQTSVNTDEDKDDAEEGIEEEDGVPFVSYNKTVSGSHLEDENFKREEVELDEGYVDERVSSYLDQKEEKFDVEADLNGEKFIQQGDGVEVSVEEPKIPNVDMTLSEIPFSARKEKFGAGWITWLKRKIGIKKRQGKEGFLENEILDGEVSIEEASESMAETASALNQEDLGLEAEQSIPLSEPPNKKKKDIPRIVLYSSLAVASLFTLGWFVPVDGEETVKDKIVGIFADEPEYVATKPVVTPPPPPLPQPTLDEVEKDMKNDPETKMLEKSKEIQKTLNRQFDKTSLIVEKVEFVGNVIKVEAKAPLTADYEANAAVIRLQKNLLPFLEGDMKNEIALQTAKGVYRYQTPTVVISFVSDLHMLDRHALEMWWRNSEIKRDGINLKSYYRQDRLYVKALKPIFETPEIAVKKSGDVKADNLSVKNTFNVNGWQTIEDSYKNISFQIPSSYKKTEFPPEHTSALKSVDAKMWDETETSNGKSRFIMLGIPKIEGESAEDLNETFLKAVLDGAEIFDETTQKNVFTINNVEVTSYTQEGSNIFDYTGVFRTEKYNYVFTFVTDKKGSTEFQKIIKTVKLLSKTSSEDDGESPISTSSTQPTPSDIQPVATPVNGSASKGTTKTNAKVWVEDSQKILSFPLNSSFKRLTVSDTATQKVDAFMNKDTSFAVEISKKKRSFEGYQAKTYKATMQKESFSMLKETFADDLKKVGAEQKGEFQVSTYESKDYKAQTAIAIHDGRGILLTGVTKKKSDKSFDNAISSLRFIGAADQLKDVTIKKSSASKADIKQTAVHAQLAFDQNRSYDKSNNQTKGLIAGYNSKTKKRVVFEVLDTKKLFESYEVAVNKKSILNESISKATDSNKNGYLDEAEKRAVEGKAIYVLEKKSNTVFALVYQNKRLETL